PRSSSTWLPATSADRSTQAVPEWWPRLSTNRNPAPTTSPRASTRPAISSLISAEARRSRYSPATSSTTTRSTSAFSLTLSLKTRRYPANKSSQFDPTSGPHPTLDVGLSLYLRNIGVHTLPAHLI